MQTSSKVTSAKKISLLASLFKNLLGDKPTEPIGSAGGKGHYFESKGAIEHSFQCRRNQSQRRKLARRVG